MFCSTIIATINRPTLARAVQSILEQDFASDEFEIIVVNDSSAPLSAGNWQSSPNVRVVATDRAKQPPQRITLQTRTAAVAFNTGAEIAQGKYLHFLGDDDLLVPGALEIFWKLHETDKADWIYGGYEVVDDDGNLTAKFQPTISGNIFPILVAGEAIPLQASLLSASLFHQIGGFDPTFWTTEDRELGRRFGLKGDVAGTSSVVVKIRAGESNSSTRGKWVLKPEVDRRGRENALNQPGAFSRVRTAASSPYWQGRVTRAYLASMVWNLRHGLFRNAAERAFCSCYLAAGSLLSPMYWQGMGHSWKSR